MRIAVFHNLPSGGARRAAFELVKHTLDVHDYDFYRLSYAASSDALAGSQDIGPLAKEVFDYELRFGSRGPGDFRRVLTIRASIEAQKQIAHDIDSRGYDLVFVHHDRFTHAPPLLSFLRTPSLYFVQEPRRASFEYALKYRHRAVSGPASRGLRLIGSAVDLWLQARDIEATRAASRLVANSYHSAEFIWRAYGCHAVVIYLGVDADLFGLSAGPRHGFLSVGALDPIKGHELVVEAVGELPPQKRPPLTIAFDRERPGVRDLLGDMARERGVELRFRRGIDDRELVALYQSSLATICTGSVEPFGLTTVESLACGTPVVALREGGYREVVNDGKNGFLVDRRPGQLSSALARVIDDPGAWDPPAMRATVMPFFSWEAAAERMKPVFQEAGRAST